MSAFIRNALIAGVVALASCGHVFGQAVVTNPVVTGVNDPAKAAITSGTINGVAVDAIANARVSYRDRGYEFYDAFSRADTAAGVIGTSDSGHTYDFRQAGLAPSTIGRVSTRRLAVTAGEMSSVGGYYAITQLAFSKVRHIGFTGRFTASGGASANRGAHVAIVGANGGLNFLLAVLHWVTTPATTCLQFFVSPSATACIASATFASEIPQNTDYSGDLFITGDVVFGIVNGVQFVARDSRIEQYNGPYVGFESFANTASVNELAQFTSWGADSYTPAATTKATFAPGGVAVGTSATGSKVDYVDTFPAPFSGSTFDARNYFVDGALTQTSAGAVIAGDSVNYKGITGYQSYERSPTLQMAFTVTTPAAAATYGCAGFAAQALASVCGNLSHAINFFGGTVKVTEANVDKVTTSLTWSSATAWDFLIKVYATGAKYFASNDGRKTWPFLLYDSTGGAIVTSPLWPRLTAYVGTWSYDNLTISNGQDVLGQGQITSGALRVEGKITSTPFTFANIATAIPNNGDMQYCSDCTRADPCAGSGTGAFARRLNGVNVCN